MNNIGQDSDTGDSFYKSSSRKILNNHYHYSLLFAN